VSDIQARVIMNLAAVEAILASHATDTVAAH